MICTASYKNVINSKYRLVAISGNRGKNADFVGEVFPRLAPKKEFWQIWQDNKGKNELENNRYYIEEYYKQVLSKLDPLEVYQILDNSILLCYEAYYEFCHRHIVAAWLELSLNVEVKEVYNREYYIGEYPRPTYIKEMLREIMAKDNKLIRTK